MSQWRNLSLSGALRVLAVVAFLGFYSIVTLHLVELQQKQNCPSVNEIMAQVRTIEEQEHAKGLQMLNLTLNEIVNTREGKNLRGQITAPLGKAVDIPADKSKEEKVKKEERKKPSMYVSDDMPVNVLLNQSYTPNFVFYVWCGSRWFEFVHYLSVLSVARHIRPDNIIVYYDIKPVVDSWTYNTWFNELFDKFPFFHGYTLSQTDYGCSRFGQANMTFITKQLAKSGGMYINETTVLNSFPLQLRLDDLVLGENDDGSIALLMTKAGFPGSAGVWANMQDRSIRSSRFPCVSRQIFIQQSDANAARCVQHEGPLFPKDIWELNDQFGRLVRTVFYGGPEILQATPSYDTLIPNIAHIVWLGRGYMDFLFYLNVLSLIYVAKVDMVYIHGDGPPSGWYWDLLKSNAKIQLIYRESPGLVYGTAVNVVSHVTDVWRVDFMIKYGGIYVDTDVVFVRPLDYEIRGYDAVGTYDWTYWNHPFPDTINFGVAIGKRNAPYWHKFQESMKWFMDEDWSWNGLRQPYRILERQPDLVRIDPRLQVTCFQSKCHPTWWPDYHNESVHHLNSPSIKNWREDIYAFHWTLPTPYELSNYTTLLSTNTMFSEIGQHILQQAGMMDYFTRIVEKEKLRKTS